MNIPRHVGAVILVLGVLGLAGCSWGLLRGYAAGPSAVLRELAGSDGTLPGATRLAFDDFGALNTGAMETHALPWKVLVAALLVIRRDRGEDLPLREEAVLPILQEFGLIVPDSILNMGEAPRPHRLSSPMGLLRGTAARRLPRVELEVANLGCAACHAGVTYDGEGTPRMAVWLGLPNTSLNLDALTGALHEAFLWVAEDPARFRAALDSVYPSMTPTERRTLHGHVLPAIEEQILHAHDLWGRPVPYEPGGPGMANGLGALRHVLGLFEPEGGRIAMGAAVGIPDLGGRILKSSLAADGTFGIPGEARFKWMGHAELTPEHLDAKAGVVAFFAGPTMGLGPDRVDRIVPSMRSVVDFLVEYRPPSFPGSVDRSLAARGERVYAARCASCHGEHRPIPDMRLERYPNVVVPVAEIGTDPVRWQAAEAELGKAIANTGAGHLLAIRATEGYMAPPLVGLWATAPYLHNGPVPTLWHLMHPEGRPERFEVGGHRLDFGLVGIDGELDRDGVYRYPTEYEPWSTPAVCDATLPGRSIGGTRRRFAA